MREPWSILSKRYGGDVRNPSSQDLASAVAELFIEKLPGVSAADYEEHGSAFLRHGYDDGPMYVLIVDRGGTATLSSGRTKISTPSLPSRRHCVPLINRKPCGSGKR
jgi:hypothetical protein